jgi:two-component system chemotaxis response regulator CheB
VKVVKRWPGTRREKARATTPPSVKLDRPRVKAELVAIGASTGGPQALHTILSGLPRDFPVPIMIAQHIAPSFAEGFAHWLNESCPLAVQVAVQREPVCAGHVYIAPAGQHMRVDPKRRIALGNGVEGNGPCPSVSSLFSSVIPVYGKGVVGILLTGMGRDGAEELKLMKDRGAITIVQDKDSSVVHGMPGAALQLGAEVHVLTPDEIVEKLRELV